MRAMRVRPTLPQGERSAPTGHGGCPGLRGTVRVQVPATMHTLQCAAAGCSTESTAYPPWSEFSPACTGALLVTPTWAPGARMRQLHAQRMLELQISGGAACGIAGRSRGCRSPRSEGTAVRHCAGRGTTARRLPWSCPARPASGARRRRSRPPPASTPCSWPRSPTGRCPTSR